MEKMNGWDCQLYEATGKMVAVAKVKSQPALKPNATFEEYLAAGIPEDGTEHVSVNPFKNMDENYEGALNDSIHDPECSPSKVFDSGNNDAGDSRSPIEPFPDTSSETQSPLACGECSATCNNHARTEGSGVGDFDNSLSSTSCNNSTQGQSPASKPAPPKKPGKPRKITAKCWMAASFPMSLRQLLPILDVIGHANKHIRKVSKFMNKYGDMDLFPVKVQVSVSQNVVFHHSSLLHLGVLHWSQRGVSCITINVAMSQLSRVCCRYTIPQACIVPEVYIFHRQLNQSSLTLRSSIMSIQVPLMATAHFLVSFKNFKQLEKEGQSLLEDFFAVPTDCKKVRVFATLQSVKNALRCLP